MENKEGRIYLPETQALIDSLKSQPTDAERISALEIAVADLAIQAMGVSEDA